jgi:C-terminal processing protease CtpA/Prc
LTTATYLTPSGRSIHEKGIDPDIAVLNEAAPSAPKEKMSDLDVEAILKNPESPSFIVSEAIEKEFLEPDISQDAQLQRAVAFLKDKIANP